MDLAVGVAEYQHVILGMLAKSQLEGSLDMVPQDCYDACEYFDSLGMPKVSYPVRVTLFVEHSRIKKPDLETVSVAAFISRDYDPSDSTTFAWIHLPENNEVPFSGSVSDQMKLLNYHQQMCWVEISSLILRPCL